nr:hypothetical protein [Trinickia fusca]
MASPAFADSDRKPVILDTQTGINDGQSGIVMQNAPLSRKPIVAAQPPAAPTQLEQSNGQTPMIVAPYIKLPASGASMGAGGAGATPPPIMRVHPGANQ